MAAQSLIYRAMDAARDLQVPDEVGDNLGLGLSSDDYALLRLALVALDINRPVQDALNQMFKLHPRTMPTGPWVVTGHLYDRIKDVTRSAFDAEDILRVATNAIMLHGPYASFQQSQPLRKPDGTVLKDDQTVQRLCSAVLEGLLG